jgi:two-component system sensor histidine kinase BaeS
MADRLDRSRADRQSLLADVTHELRTPLTVISGGIEAMLDGVHPADEDHLAPILEQARVMDRLLDDLRTMSLAESGALPLYREPVDLRTIGRDVVSAHAAVAQAAGVRLTAEDDGPLETNVDPVRVREILGNLVANALRHTPPGGFVSVSVARDGDDAVLTVRDTGEGIPPEDLVRIFDRFQRRRSDSGGSGLGLTIARDLAAAHGGSIEADSDGVPGRGSTFRVRLPLRD